MFHKLPTEIVTSCIAPRLSHRDLVSFARVNRTCYASAVDALTKKKASNFWFLCIGNPWDEPTHTKTIMQAAMNQDPRIAFVFQNICQLPRNEQAPVFYKKTPNESPVIGINLSKIFTQNTSSCHQITIGKQFTAFGLLLRCYTLNIQETWTDKNKTPYEKTFLFHLDKNVEFKSYRTHFSQKKSTIRSVANISEITPLQIQRLHAIFSVVYAHLLQGAPQPQKTWTRKLTDYFFTPPIQLAHTNNTHPFIPPRVQEDLNHIKTEMKNPPLF